MQKKKESLMNLANEIDVLHLPNFLLKRLKVLNASEKDLEPIQNLESIIFENPWHMFDFTFFYSVCSFKVVKIKDFIVGYTIFRFERDYKNKKKICHLLKIGVHPEFQHMGVGSILIKDMIYNMRKNKTKIVYLEVREGNKNAISFYEKKGFFKGKLVENYYENQESAYMMIKIF
jgi:ribosomal-protein-alanine N-acetyltransferase